MARRAAGPAGPTLRYTEQWARTLRRQKDVRASCKVVGDALADEFADWHTGRNAWPSATTLAEATGLSVPTVVRDLEFLEDGGWLARSGITRPKNTTDRLLVYPASLITGDKTDTVEQPASHIAGDKTDARQSYQNQPPVLSESAASLITGDRQPPHHLITNTVSDEGGGGANAPAAGASDAPRLDVDTVAALLDESLPDDWLTAKNRPIPTNEGLGNAIADRLDAGWTVDNFTAAFSGLGKPARVRNPTAVCVAQLDKFPASKTAPVMLAARAPAAGAADAGRDTPKAKPRASKPKAPKPAPAPRPPADPTIGVVGDTIPGWHSRDVEGILAAGGRIHADEQGGAWVELSGTDWTARLGVHTAGGPQYVHITGTTGGGWEHVEELARTVGPGNFRSKARTHIRANGGDVRAVCLR